METFADISSFNAGVKEKNTNTNNITMNGACGNFYGNLH
jgi:hypothetical protein